MAKTPQTIRVPFSAVTYSKAAARYRSPVSGRFISPATVRDIVERDIDATRTRIERHAATLGQQATRYMAGEIDAKQYAAAVEAWRDIQAREVKALHLAYLALGKGGFHEFTQADFGRVGAELRKQYGYLNRRAGIAANNPAYAASGAFVLHAGKYADAGLTTYEVAKLQADKAAGMLWERNVLDNAHHCSPKNGAESCPQQTAKGVVEIGKLVTVGRRACNVACRCRIERFKTREAAEDALGVVK